MKLSYTVMYMPKFGELTNVRCAYKRANRGNLSMRDAYMTILCQAQTVMFLKVQRSGYTDSMSL